MRIGVDTGGTFTDFIVIENGKIEVYKIPSTPADPAIAVLEGLDQAAPRGKRHEIVHGSTVATNSILTGGGALTALITTAGFEDVLEIGRQTRDHIYDLSTERPPPLVPRSLRFGVRERTDHLGKVMEPVVASELTALVNKLKRRKVESIAVCLLFSYANPRNEKALHRALKALGLPISLSHDILPEYREYERTSTTVINAYVAPVMEKYLGRLEEESGSPSFKVMQSNGGVITARSAIRQPVRTILSGPSGGVLGACQVARLAGYENVITFDMGGTSTDVSLCKGGIQTTTETTISGHPVKVPVIDIHTVGAGGGSIAYLDEGGSLRVGPQSAGADPGPICYGKGSRLTITDAQLFLGRLDPHNFLGGRMKLHPEKVLEPMERLAREMGLPPVRAAEGIIRVANATMERAIRVISVERGHDPREFALISFGGAGALHACELARSLSIPTVLVPQNAGVLSALGMLLADFVRDYSRTVMLLEPQAPPALLSDLFKPMEDRGMDEMLSEGVPEKSVRLERSLDVRYPGQSYELTVPFRAGYASLFHRAHEAMYGHSKKGSPVEIVNLRLRVVGKTYRRPPRRKPLSGKSASAALTGRRPIVLDGRKTRAAFYRRELLKPGNVLTGPAVILEFSATTLVPPDCSCTVDRWGNLILTV
jgi:N-methylhydantoinase A